LLAVSLALLAALLFATGASLQQEVGRAECASPAPAAGRLQAWLPITGAMHRLVRHPVWLTGYSINAVGFLTQAIALHHGTVALVQPILVTQLLFTIPITVWHTRRRPSPQVLVSGAAVFLGVVLFIGNWGTGDRTRVLLAVLVALGLAVVLVTRSARLRPAARTVATAIAAGLCFAVTAALMKLTLDTLLRNGVIATAQQWSLYGLVVSTLLGLIIGQDALAGGALSTAVAGMAITNPVASTAIGVFGFQETVPLTSGVVVGLAAAGILIVFGVIGLAQSPVVGGGPGDPTRRLPRNQRALERRFT
jgi:drug/metabolite transporter (DMT)-like permease